MLVYFAVSFAVLLGFIGLAVDVGRMELATIQLQAVADDAALTAATEYENGNGSYKTVGAAEAASIGAANGLSSVSASFHFGADTGPYVNSNSVIQATVTQPLSLYFLPFITGSSTTTLTALAVAQLQPCFFFMTPTINPDGYSIELNNSHPVDARYCPTYAVGGISVDSSSNLDALQLQLTGASSASSILGAINATPIYQSAVRTDPLSYVVAPVFSSCTAGDHAVDITSSPATLYPGTYCGGLTIENFMTVTMEPGLYIITGGFTLGVGGTLNGNGVTMYFTQGGGSSFGTISFGSGTTGILEDVNLTAPVDSSAGGIPAIVVYVDPAWTGTSQVGIVNCSWAGDGIIYSQATGVNLYNSFMTTSNYFSMDVAYLYMHSTSLHLNNDYSTLTIGDPFRVAVNLVQ